MKQEKTMQTKQQLLNLTEDFCNKKLDEEHKELAHKLIHAIFRNSNHSFANEKPAILAAGVIHAIGSVNLLFDDSFEPYISEQELNDDFETNPEMTNNYSVIIREQLNLNFFDREYPSQVHEEDHPLKDMISIDGIHISLDLLPSSLKKKVEEARAEGFEIEFRSDEV